MLDWAFGGRACHLVGWPPLSDGQNSTFLAPPRASGAPAARRANLGRAHPPPDGWNRHSVAVRATSSAGPPSQLPETAISQRHIARRGRPQRGALIWGAPTHPQMAGIRFRWPCVPPRRLAPPLRRPRRPFVSVTPLIGGAFAPAEILRTPLRKALPISVGVS